jgi:hypothetical protein
MEPASSSGPPLSWIHKRDGRLVPFDADKLSRSLFAATESLGQPDPFLARELADSIIHFLADEAVGSIPTTAHVADLAIKVVRELGHPALSRAYQDGQEHKQHHPSVQSTPVTPTTPGAAVGPSLHQIGEWVDQANDPSGLTNRIARECLRAYSLSGIYSRDLATAHYQGLITLHGLEMPLELAAVVLPTSAVIACDMAEELFNVRRIAGGFVALSGPEYHLAQAGADGGIIRNFIRGMRLGLRGTGLRAVINLNSFTAPASAEWLGDGPLFAPHRVNVSRSEVDACADALYEQLVADSGTDQPWRIDWHLGARDFFPDTRARLQRIAKSILKGAAIAMVLDRPYKPLHLAEGLAQKSPALLGAITLNLPRLIGQIGGDLKPDAFLQKLRSLARLALSAGVQKRDFLRRHAGNRPALGGAFLLDRARLMIIPEGIAPVAETFCHAGSLSPGQTTDFTRRVLDHLVRALREESQARLLDNCVETLPELILGDQTFAQPSLGQGVAAIEWQDAEHLHARAETAGSLHALTGAGTVHVYLRQNGEPTAEELADFLEFAWQRTAIVRVRFHSAATSSRQLTAPWELDAS